MRSFLIFFAVMMSMLRTSHCSKGSKKKSKHQPFQPTVELPSKSPLELIQESTCGELFKSANNFTRDYLERILPNERFYNFIKNNSAPSDDIMLIDVDRQTGTMLLNQAIALKMAGSKLIVHAVAHDPDTCHNITAKGVPCYYDHKWYKEISYVYTEWAGHAFKINLVMLIRMMTTTIALCEGRNVFLSDSDVLFYHDPMNYVFKDVNIMVTASEIDIGRWSGPFFSDKPNQGQTLNNGVVFYRSNELTQAFLLTLAAHCVSVLVTNHNDLDTGFLQTTFNVDLNRANLKVQPSRDMSSNITYKLTYLAGYSNPAGECYDCYYGKVPWRSDVVATANTSVLRVGVFPMARCLSSSFVSQRGEELLIASAEALRNHDSTRWGWGELDGESRMMCVHANGHAKASEDETVVKVSGKEIWFRNISSWFLDV